MALPHLPAYFTTRKNVYEAAMVNRRTRETDFREKWQDVSSYFHKNNVAANKKKAWESDECFQNSMDSWNSAREENQKKERLALRRKLLGEMLKEEMLQHEAELRGLSREHHSLLEDMKEKCENLRSAREEKRSNQAQERLYEHWRQNNPDIRDLETEQHRLHVLGKWSEQKKEREEREEKEKKDKEELEKRLEEARQEAVREEQRQQQQRIDEEKELKNILKNQMLELKSSEDEARRLKKEEEKILRNQWQLEKAEQERKCMEEERKKLEFGKVLLRQHAAALRRRSQQIQKELEEDQRFLNQLVQQEAEEQEIKTARRDQARADASWMKKVVEEQLKVEKAREAELDLLFQDEAARVWEQREAEWQKERVARERLMQEVLAERHDQIQAKMAAVHQLQEESLQRREELLDELELANQLTRREQEQDEVMKTQRKKELLAQISSRQEKHQQIQAELKLELDQNVQVEQDYEEMLRQEAERMNIHGYEPKQHVRKQAWM